jgi:hypothetical protein
MKKVWIVITLAVFVLVSTGMTSCKKKEEAPGTETLEKKTEEAKQAEKPADAKPKDHPAH